ncbi:asparaginase, partial [Patescibacteria group bacterium]|nr:asparaginase [Patescibacteria group bacterium]
MKEKSERKILVLYTGGTIGMHREAEKGPLKPGTAEDLQKNIPELEDLPYNIEWQEFRKDGEFIDSSNADVEYYNQLAKELGKAQEKYDGIVVVFGTDTMAPSAGSISYMLEGLKKPIVFTGSMIPAIDEGSDGPKNLIDAIHVAAKSGNE